MIRYTTTNECGDEAKHVRLFALVYCLSAYRLPLISARQRWSLGLVAMWLILAWIGTTSFGQTTFLPGQPWPNSRPITISFAPDLIEIGRYRNELFMHMQDQMSHPDWQIEILRACQTWSRQANVQFAVASDSPRAFGAPGLTQWDPRFGDIRLGAFPQQNVLGNVIPYNPGASSWAGDIFFNTNCEYYIHDFSQGSNSPFNMYDLYSVALHEIGNALGLVDQMYDTTSVMYYAYTVPRIDLSLLDMENIQMLYGPPAADPYEMRGSNDNFATATPLTYPENFLETFQVIVPGRIQHGADVDIYKIHGNPLAENCWIKLRVRGRSLLCGRITAYDEQFQEIATNEAENPLRINVIKEITGIADGELVYIAVDWSGYPDFEFGEYELVLDFNEDGDSEAEDWEREYGDDDDDELERFFEAGDAALVDGLLDEFGLVDLENAANNTFATSVLLSSPPGTPRGSRFEILSAIASPTDIDMYRLVTSPSAQGSMAIDLSPLGLDVALLDVRVYNSNRKQLAISRRFRSDGDVVAVVENVQPNKTYYIAVRNRTGNTIPGNYVLVVNVADRSAVLETIQQVNLSASQKDRFGILTTYKTQLFRFDLTMTSANNNNQAAQFTIYSPTGQVEVVTSVRSGRSRTVYVWLHAGDHYLRFTAVGKNNAAIKPSVVTLSGAIISDDEGPVLIDPSGNPTSGPQNPGSNPTPPPTWNFPSNYGWLFELVIPPENPWF